MGPNPDLGPNPAQVRIMYPHNLCITPQICASVHVALKAFPTVQVRVGAHVGPYFFDFIKTYKIANKNA